MGTTKQGFSFEWLIPFFMLAAPVGMEFAEAVRESESSRAYSALKRNGNSRNVNLSSGINIIDDSEIEVFNIAIGFLAGIAGVAGAIIAYKVYRKSQPSIEMVWSTGSPFLSPEEEEKKYTWSFTLGFQNKKPVEYALLNVRWLPYTNTIGSVYPFRRKGWKSLTFNSGSNKYTHNPITPLVFTPYDYKEIRALWRQNWVDDPRSEGAREYWEKNPADKELFDSIITSLHTRKVLFLLEFADGKQKICRMG